MMNSPKNLTSQSHWQEVYNTKAIDDVSWYQEHAKTSLRLIHSTQASLDDAIIDVGAGASTLVDDLLIQGYRDVSVLDISRTALYIAQQRLGKNATRIQWLEADITQAKLPQRHYQVWHDRAVFHFLTTTLQRQAYMHVLRYSLRIHGSVIIATFADNGPTQCSGLPVVRYNADNLAAAFGSDFYLEHFETEVHQTPWAAAQSFIYCHFRFNAQPVD